MPWRRIVFSLLLVVGLLFVGRRVMARLIARRKPPVQAEAEIAAIAVRVRPLKRETYREQLVGYGRARALRRARVAAEVAGVVRTVSKKLEAGALVTAGEKLITLDDRDLKATRAGILARQARNAAEKRRLQADLKTNAGKLRIASTELEVAERELIRLKDMGDAATPSEIDRERLRVTVRRTAVLDLEGRASTLAVQVDGNTAEATELAAQLMRADTDIERTEITAPFTGRIESRLVDQFDRVGVGTLLFEILDPQSIEIPVSLPASRYGEVRAGTVAKVTSSGRTEDWTIARVAPTVRAEDRTFFVYLTREKPNVPPGAFVTVRVPGRSHENVFVIPRTALMGDLCFVAVEGRARARKPEVAHVLSHAILASGGVDAGESLVVTNLEEIAEDARITPLPENTKQ